VSARKRSIFTKSISYKENRASKNSLKVLKRFGYIKLPPPKEVDLVKR
jgi:hypothetical protein